MPSLSNKTDVLVVGAGPTGLLTALELARAGVEVEIVDRAWRSTAQSYACGLHAATVELLAQLGLERAALDAGRRIDTLAFFEGSERRAELRMGALEMPFPFVLVLPQDRLEELLELELRERGVRVRWGHRLDDLTQDGNAVTSSVEKLALTSVGYPYARSEEMVQSEVEVRARFVVGADGAASHVRQVLGIETDAFGPPTAYEVFEFEAESEAAPEIRIALGAATTDAFWPQPDSACRWSLQQSDGGGADTGTDPNLEPAAGRDEAMDAEDRRELTECLRARAPWFTAGIKAIDWRSLVRFERMAARAFGRGRCWLVGDAGHQTSPVGMQSMNVGLREARDLARRLAAVLRQDAPETLLAEYGAERRAEWEKLLGNATGPVPAARGNATWLQAHRARLLPCLPGSGAALAALAGQLGLQVA